MIGLKIAGGIFFHGRDYLPVCQCNPVSGGDLGDTLIADKRVKLVTFTGSIRLVPLSLPKRPKFLLNVTGTWQNPLIILDDADLDYAVNTTAFSNFSPRPDLHDRFQSDCGANL